MFSRYTMPRTNNSALEQRECGFNGVGVNGALNIDVLLVLDSPVFFGWHSRLPKSKRIGYELVRNNHIYVLTDVFFDVLRQRSGLRIFSMKKPQLTVAL